MKLTSFRWSSSFMLALACVAGVVPHAAHAAFRGPLRSAATATPAETEARVIVKFKSGSTLMRAQSLSNANNGSDVAGGPQNARAMSTRLGLALTDGHPMGARSQLMKGHGLSSAALAARLSAQSDVEYAVVDGRRRILGAPPNDPLYLNTSQAQTPLAGQWYLQAPSATLVSAINAEVAWAVSTGKSSIVVADLDTGVRRDHPDLTSKLLAGYDFITDVATANDGDGRDADPSDPGDGVTSADVGTVSGCTSSDVGNSSWHGTQTAGLLGAATNNGIGMASIGHDVMVLPVRVLGKCGGFDSDIIDAMRWAAGIAVSGVPANPNPARVINMSLGSQGACSSTGYQDVINELAAINVVVVVAAGNGDSNGEGIAVTAPANCTGVIAVAGMRQSGTKVAYSNLGPEVAISAPAGNCVNTAAGSTCLYPILTTSNSGAIQPVAGAAGAIYTSGGDDKSLGTSFSTPLVSGTAALMLSANPSLTSAQVTAALKTTARPFPQTGAATAGAPACVDPATTSTPQDECYCTTSTCGAGLLDAGAAVASIATLTANIYAPTLTTLSIVAGTPVTLDGSGSVVAAGGNPITAYQWAITSGGDVASITGAADTATVTLTPTAAGTVTVSLTVTDSAGQQSGTATTLNVAAGPVTASGGGGGGGGGAVDPAWLLALIGAVLLLWVEGRRQT